MPTLGVLRTGGRAHLFWRALGYTGDLSLWLYVPLSPQDETGLNGNEGRGLLDGIVYRSRARRYVTVGVADLNRLIFERKWSIPPNLQEHELIHPLINFVQERLP